MDKKLLKEILAAHADKLLEGKASGKDYLALLSEQGDELEPLLSVAEQIESTLRPLTPPSQFEEELRRELLTTAHLRKVEGYVPPNPERDLFYALVSLAFIISLGVILALMRRYQT